MKRYCLFETNRNRLLCLLIVLYSSVASSAAQSAPDKKDTLMMPYRQSFGIAVSRPLSYGAHTGALSLEAYYRHILRRYFLLQAAAGYVASDYKWRGTPSPDKVAELHNNLKGGFVRIGMHYITRRYLNWNKNFQRLEHPSPNGHIGFNLLLGSYSQYLLLQAGGANLSPLLLEFRHKPTYAGIEIEYCKNLYRSKSKRFLTDAVFRYGTLFGKRHYENERYAAPFPGMNLHKGGREYGNFFGINCHYYFNL